MILNHAILNPLGFPKTLLRSTGKFTLMPSALSIAAKNKRRLFFDSQSDPNADHTTIIGDTPELIPVSINGFAGDLYYEQERDKASVLVWYEDHVIFTLFGELTQEEFIRIAESVRQIRP